MATHTLVQVCQSWLTKPRGRASVDAPLVPSEIGGRALSIWTTLVLVAAAGISTQAHGSLVKPNGSPPLEMPNTLGIETRPPKTPARPGNALNTASTSATTGRCAASAVRLARSGVRIVTAKHCAAEVLEVFDERHRVVPVGRSFVGNDVDLALLDVRGTLPWRGLEPRKCATLQVGERLCAWRFERAASGVSRERICGRVVRLSPRAGAPPLIELNHPYPPGTSGSALVDRDGRIAGVVVASNTDVGVAEPIDTVLAWDEAGGALPRTKASSLPISKCTTP